MTGRGCVGSLGSRAREALREFEAAPEGEGPEVEVRDHGREGWWVQGPADVVEALAPAWSARIGAAVRGWVVRVERTDGLVRTTLVGRRWDPSGVVAVLAREEDEDEDLETPIDEIARGRLEIALDLYERLHQDDAHFEIRRLKPI